MSSFRAYLVDHSSGAETGGVTDLSTDLLGEGDVTIRVRWSSVNYKDGLAASSKGRVARISPLIPGIDLAGEVVTSASAAIAVGQQVIVHGYGLGVSHHGGYAELARVPAEWVVPLPEGLTMRDAMALGTAGYTAAACVAALEHGGLTPDRGEILVLGASGGVGSIALSILKARGYTAVAVTGKADQADALSSLGAADVLARDEVTAEGKPLERERWAGCVDAVGGAPLNYALRTLRYGASVASCGNVAGTEVHSSIFPFILRGVALRGIDSVQVPIATRRALWSRMATDMKPQTLGSSMVHETTLDGLSSVLAETLAGQRTGRTVVNIGG